MERPSLRRAVIAPESAQVPPSPALPRLDFRVRVDSEMDERDALLVMARPEQVDARMISAAAGRRPRSPIWQRYGMPACTKGRWPTTRSARSACGPSGLTSRTIRHA